MISKSHLYATAECVHSSSQNSVPQSVVYPPTRQCDLLRKSSPSAFPQGRVERLRFTPGQVIHFLKRRAGEVVKSQPTCFANGRKLLISRVFWRKRKSTSWIYYDDTFSLERNRNRRKIESIPRGIGIEYLKESICTTLLITEERILQSTTITNGRVHYSFHWNRAGTLIILLAWQG